MKFSSGDLIYQGEKSGVHNWNTVSGTSFYWHPDWLHIAEDMTGHSATAKLDVAKGKATKADAEKTIISHLNK
jgi:cell wall assembly regulator SMI1